MLAKELEKIAGFQLPLDFVSVIEGFQKKFGGLDEAISEFMNDLNCSRFAHIGEARDYENTPLEIWPFIGSGSDGEHYGYLILAPELAANDFPLVCYSPMGSYVDFWGNSTKEGLAHLLSYWHAEDNFSNIDLPLLNSVGIHPDASRYAADYLSLNYDPSALKTPPLYIPDGYAFVMTRDGAGVLAKKNLFDPARKLAVTTDISATEYIRMAQDNMDAGFWATALFYLKECWHEKYYSGDDDTLSQLKEMMMAVYAAMGRSVYAERLDDETLWL